MTPYKTTKLQLETPTRLQKHLGMNMFNSHRECVIQRPANLNVIPSSLPIIDPVTKRTLFFKITYKGQKKYCSRCCEEHVGGCPELKEFYEAKAKRQQMREENEIQTKIVSDSSLRHADPLGLKADILSTPGAGFGLIAQTAIDDPGCEDVKHIIVAGGTNDVFKEIDDDKFAFGFDKGMEKIKGLAANHPEKKFTIITPMLDEEQLTPSQTIRSRYLQTKTKVVAMASENISFMDADNLPVFDDENIEEGQSPMLEMEDNRHPDKIGTLRILSMINKENNIIWNEKFCTNDQTYQRIKRIPKYGCRGCHRFKENGVLLSMDDYDLCRYCEEEFMSEQRHNPILDLIKEITQDEQNRKRKVSVGSLDSWGEGLISDSKRLAPDDYSMSRFRYNNPTKAEYSYVARVTQNVTDY